jgi:uncharacterized alpha-E superfamily protein
MMLARVAEALFWASRDIERAETTARGLAVGHAATLEAAFGSGSAARGEASWEALVELAGDPEAFSEIAEEATATSVSWYLTFGEGNPNSVESSITRARETVRSVRDQLPSEVWEAVNTLYLDLADWSSARLEREGPYPFCAQVRQQIFLVYGLVEHSVRHDDAYQFFRLGRFLERADRTARLLEVAHNIGADREPTGPFDVQRSATVLRAARAFEAFIAVEPNDMSSAAVSRFLILDDRHPCAISFCIDNLADALRDLARTGDILANAPPHMAVGVARDLLDTAGRLPWDRILAQLLARLRRLADTIEATIVESCFLAEYDRRPADAVVQSTLQPQD